MKYLFSAFLGTFFCTKYKRKCILNITQTSKSKHIKCVSSDVFGLKAWIDVTSGEEVSEQAGSGEQLEITESKAQLRRQKSV